jgi:hypothetical protein
MKRFAAFLCALTKRYDVPADHAYSRQSIIEQRDAAIEELARARLHLMDARRDIEVLREQLAGRAII